MVRYVPSNSPLLAKWTGAGNAVKNDPAEDNAHPRARTRTGTMTNHAETANLLLKRMNNPTEPGPHCNLSTSVAEGFANCCGNRNPATSIFFDLTSTSEDQQQLRSRFRVLRDNNSLVISRNSYIHH